MTDAEWAELQQLSDKGTPGPWHEPRPFRVNFKGLPPGPVMSYLQGGPESAEGMKVSLGSERHADHQFVAKLVNAFRAGELIRKEKS